MSTHDHAQGGQQLGSSAGASPATPGLSESDALACDALFDGAPSQSGHRDIQLSRLLAMLDTPAPEIQAHRELMIDLTLARASRARRQTADDVVGGVFIGGDLSPDDDDALEALIASSMDPAQVPGALRRRAERIGSLLDTLAVSKSEIGSTNDLVQRTLARVQESVAAEESRFAVAATGANAAEGPGLRLRFRLGDLVSIAAIVLVGFGVLMPMADAVQGASRRSACQANLAAAGLGFGLYAGSNKDSLPLASASPAGRPWWFVGKSAEQSNSANLYTLVRSGMNKVSDLACGGNERAVFSASRPDATDWGCLEEVSYSYQNMFAAERPRWTGSTRAVLLVDRSPVILKAYNRMVIDPLENSPNHRRRGQAALVNDGSVQWLKSPVLSNGDNIWLPRAIEDVIRQLTQPRAAEPLKGTESPAGADDVFVGP